MINICGQDFYFLWTYQKFFFSKLCVLWVFFPTDAMFCKQNIMRAEKLEHVLKRFQTLSQVLKSDRISTLKHDRRLFSDVTHRLEKNKLPKMCVFFSLEIIWGKCCLRRSRFVKTWEFMLVTGRLFLWWRLMIPKVLSD